MRWVTGEPPGRVAVTTPRSSSIVDGARVGVLVMLAITLAVQGGFLSFFLYLRKHAKHVAETELDNEWSELQRPSRTS